MASFSTIRALGRITLAGFVVSVLWTALLSRFAAEENPLQDAPARLLALVLAADTAVAGLWRTYSFAPTLRNMWASQFKMLWLAILATALENLVWLSLFVFLLSVWRYQMRLQSRDHEGAVAGG